MSGTNAYLKINRGETALMLCAGIYILLALSSSFYGSIDAADESVYIISAIVELAVIALPSALYFSIRSLCSRSHSQIPDLSLRGIERDKIFFTVISSLALITGATAINAVLARLGAGTSGDVIDIGGGGADDVWLRILTLAAIPAFSEELLCRGLLMSELRSLGSIRALIISSLCFAMLHFNLARLPLYLLCGFILGGVMLITRSLAATITAHFAFNLFSILSGELLRTLSEQIGDMLMLFFISAGLFIVCAIFIFREITRIFAAYAKHPENAPPPFAHEGVTPPRYSLFGAITPPLVLCVILYTVFSIFI